MPIHQEFLKKFSAQRHSNFCKEAKIWFPLSRSFSLRPVTARVSNFRKAESTPGNRRPKPGQTPGSRPPQSRLSPHLLWLNFCSVLIAELLLFV